MAPRSNARVQLTHAFDQDESDVLLAASFAQDLYKEAATLADHCRYVRKRMAEPQKFLHRERKRLGIADNPAFEPIVV